jgi:hypothetical protein
MTNMDNVYVVSLIKAMVTLRVKGEWDAAEQARIALRECGVR